MNTREGYMQGYNTQAAVTKDRMDLCPTTTKH